MAKLKRKSYFLIPLILAIFLFSLAGAGSAKVMWSRDGGVVVATDELIEDDLFASGNTVMVKGRVTGDIFATGNNLAVQGNWEGDLFAAGRQVDILGNAGSNIRAIGESINVAGNVTRNVLAAGRQFSILPGSAIGGNVLAAGETVRVEGKVQGTLRAAANKILITGEIGRNVDLQANEVIILPGAKIGGNLTYRSANPASIDPGAQIKGMIEFIKVTPPEEKPLLDRYYGAVLNWLALLLASLVFVLFLPRATGQVAEVMLDKPWHIVGLGFAGLLVPPFLAILLFITVIGKILGGVVLVGYGVLITAGLLLGNIFLGLLLGMMILRAIRKQEQVSLIWSVLIGATLLKLLSFIPVVGFLVAIIVCVLTAGALLHLAAQSWLLCSWPWCKNPPSPPSGPNEG